CEGALLLVDAAQGVQAQTLANAYLAIEGGLEIIPALNKIDLPAADPDRVAEEVASVIGGEPEEVLRLSAKTGEGVDELLERIVSDVPPPAGDPEAPLRALVFDSYYDAYRGVVSYIRVVDGVLAASDRVRFIATGDEQDADEIGFITPKAVPAASLGSVDVGYLITGEKEIDKIKVGDTDTTARRGAAAVRAAGGGVRFSATGDEQDADEIGFLTPKAVPAAPLGPGEVGYLITGEKEIAKIKVGDTVTTARRGAVELLPGYAEPKPMVYSGIFPTEGDDFEDLREALEKLSLNDASQIGRASCRERV